jgi:hypothetical protein
VIAFDKGRRAGVKSANKELGLAASFPDEMELVPVDEKSKQERYRFREILEKR